MDTDKKNALKGGRNGGFTEDKAYNGNTKKHFYRTPWEFFDGDEVRYGNEVTRYSNWSTVAIDYSKIL